ncbi:bifunctional chorismate-binding protein/class IV aminotransferase [Macrococcoides caseolyticum]|uniref:bifunctional chorismate-binding protein/class IV aminotransferase n=1 Tax=Macrococcoides caseolyticum TaxID=69966 RepID=UPI001F2AD073|nr:bifunctional anthranilate synthase component I family protein/class IV aminotransferase [Macrococcus caseolyticus]MCE4955884.1 bifunctional anthranilate synthase component I family protein/class IV aminotransferase [Macrococcus caseolyticus]
MRAEINFKYIGDKSKTYHIKLKDPVQRVTANDAQTLKAAIEEAEASDYYALIVMKYEASRLFDPLLQTKALTDDLVKIYYFDRETHEVFDKQANASHLNFKFQQDKSHIIKQIEAIQHEIRQGNTYQVNYTTRLTAHNTEKNLYHIYEKLSSQNGDYTAYIEDDNNTIISISPELFFQYDFVNKAVLTKPMKGTMPRDKCPEIDERHYQFLLNSLKDRAENVMIVDLLRNDLSKIATKGSVCVPHLFTIEKFLSVYQMTSTITATIGQNGLYDILKALFPCGSITGAPKQSTMRIINQLEETKRSVYCGTIGLIVPNEVAIFNVPIRTLEYNHLDETVIYGVGGGITIDSKPELEYEEMVAKTNVLNYINQPDSDTLHEQENITLPSDFHLIETMRLENGHLKRKNYHYERLLKGLKQFNIDYDIQAVNQAFQPEINDAMPHMYRLTVDLKGVVLSTIEPLQKSDTRATLQQITFNHKLFHQHKTSIRNQYDVKQLTLFHDGTTLLEFNIGNLVIKKDQHYYTPEHEYVLNGCMRQSLLDEGMIKEKAIRLEDFIEDYQNHQIEIYMINSLREWVRIELEI